MVELERSLPLDLADNASTLSCLLEKFSREQDSTVRAKIASLLGQIGKAPGLKSADLADDIMRLLKAESMFILFYPSKYCVLWSSGG